MSAPLNLDLSIVIPLFNEQESIMPLYEGLTAVLHRLNRSFEIIFINDGSVDESYPVLCRLAEKDRQVRVINLRRNFGANCSYGRRVRSFARAHHHSDGRRPAE